MPAVSLVVVPAGEAVREIPKPCGTVVAANGCDGRPAKRTERLSPRAAGAVTLDRVPIDWYHSVVPQMGVFYVNQRIGSSSYSVPSYRTR